MLLLAAVVLYQRICPDCHVSIDSLSFLLGAAFMLTALYLFWYKKKGLTKGLRLATVVNDVALASAALYLTGGSQSPFIFLFPIAIITACLIGGQRLGTISALLNTAAFAMIFWFSVEPARDLPKQLFHFSANMAAFNITALLAILLGRRLWKAEKHISEMEDSLHRLEEIQRHLINSMKSGLVTVDEDGRILYFNIAATEILGPLFKAGYGRRIDEVWPEGAGLLEDCLSYKRGDRKELCIKEDGKTRYLGISCFPIHDTEERFLGYGLIFQDITEAREQARRLQMIDRLAALGEMAAGLAHEIRNPLASIRGAAEFMAVSIKKEEGKDGGSASNARLLDIIVRETERLEGLTRSFLLYGRPESRNMELLDLSELVRNVVELLSKRKGFQQTRIKNAIPEGLMARADAQLMKQVFLNLLLNAWQALPKEGGEIVLKGRARDGRVEIRIIDNGHGIKEEDLSHIFNPFFTTKPDGTGLGLSIVHRIITQFGGDLTVDSAPGEGSVFTVILPEGGEREKGEGFEESGAVEKGAAGKDAPETVGAGEAASASEEKRLVETALFVSGSCHLLEPAKASPFNTEDMPIEDGIVGEKRVHPF